VAGDLERRLREEGLDPSAWSNGPGDRYGAHEHGYDKVIAVAQGSIRFWLPDEDRGVDLEEGTGWSSRPGRATTRSSDRAV